MASCNLLLHVPLYWGYPEFLVFAFQVLLNQKEISGEEIDFILDNYPAHTATNLILEERDPGSLPFFSQKQEQDTELEYRLLSP